MSKLKVTAEYEGHSVIVGEHRTFRYNEAHLKNNLKLLKSCVNRHNKVFSCRMDIRLPQDRNQAKTKKEPKKFIGDFMSVYTNDLARKGYDPDYVVKMEQKTSENPHFHAQIFVDGNKVKDQKELVEKGERLIEKQLGMEEGAATGLINYGSGKRERAENQAPTGFKNREQASHMIRRNSAHFQDQFNDCFRQMSYLAKDTDDDIVPSPERKVFYSRFNRKKCRRKD